MPSRILTALRSLSAPEGRPRGILWNQDEDVPDDRFGEGNQLAFDGGNEEGIDGGDDDAPLRRTRWSADRFGCDDGVPPRLIFRAE